MQALFSVKFIFPKIFLCCHFFFFFFKGCYIYAGTLTHMCLCGYGRQRSVSGPLSIYPSLFPYMVSVWIWNIYESHWINLPGCLCLPVAGLKMSIVPRRIYMVSGACRESTLDIELYLLTSHLLICAKIATFKSILWYTGWTMSHGKCHFMENIISSLIDKKSCYRSNQKQEC